MLLITRKEYVTDVTVSYKYFEQDSSAVVVCTTVAPSGYNGTTDVNSMDHNSQAVRSTYGPCDGKAIELALL